MTAKELAEKIAKEIRLHFQIPPTYDSQNGIPGMVLFGARIPPLRRFGGLMAKQQRPPCPVCGDIYVHDGGTFCDQCGYDHSKTSPRSYT